MSIVWWGIWGLTLLLHIAGIVFTIGQLRSPWRFPRWSAAWTSMLALIVWMGVLRVLTLWEDVPYTTPYWLALLIALVTSTLAFTTALLFSRVHQPTQTLREPPPAAITIDANSCIRVWNDRATDICGFTLLEALGQSLEIIIPERHRAAHLAGMQHWLHAADPAIDYRPFGYDIHALHKEGHEFFVHIEIQPQWTGGEWRFHGTIRPLFFV